MHYQKQRSRRMSRTARSGQMVIASAILAVATAASIILVPAASADTTISITLTPQGCKPSPATAPAGDIAFNVTNKNAGSISKAELRTSDHSHILGEQENLVPGLSGGFSANLGPGTYAIDCPGAAQRYWTFTVTGKQKGTPWQSVPTLKSAVTSYATYINQNTQHLITSSSALCTAISSDNLSAAKVAYPKARIYYERIEPVAEIWGALDTKIDGRWENPVTVLSQFIGFHRIEQLMWESNTLTGASALCTELVKNERQLGTLVKSATYNPLEMAAGATDLVNEAATAKVSGEEERYSNTDLPVLQANIDGANEVVTLLKPYLKVKEAKLVASLQSAYTKATSVANTFKATPGYDGTGYVEYSTILDAGRRKLSQAINAYAEVLSKISAKVTA